MAKKQNNNAQLNIDRQDAQLVDQALSALSCQNKRVAREIVIRPGAIKNVMCVTGGHNVRCDVFSIAW